MWRYDNPVKVLFGDGALDEVPTPRSDSDDVSVLLNNGDGTFADDVLFGAGDQPRSVAVGDLDGDSDLDLAVANALSDDVWILLNTGDGSFAARRVYDAGVGAYIVAVGDLDGDGDLDLTVANVNSDNVSVLLNLSR